MLICTSHISGILLWHLIRLLSWFPNKFISGINKTSFTYTISCKGFLLWWNRLCDPWIKLWNAIMLLSSWFCCPKSKEARPYHVIEMIIKNFIITKKSRKFNAFIISWYIYIYIHAYTRNHIPNAIFYKQSLQVDISFN